MARLKTHVHVPVGLDWVVYGPGDEVPDEHAALITNPKAWEDDTEPASAASVLATDGSGAPPKAGKGSGREVWVEFAEARGVHVDADDKREDIIAAVEAAGIATE